MTYVQKIARLCQRVQQTLDSRFGVSVDFDAPHTAGRRPGDANSEFLSNRGMGDWAEGVLKRGLSEALPEFHVLKYGNSDQIVAGDPTFAEFYGAYQNELATTGKRPDLLVFDDANYQANWGNDISMMDLLSLKLLTPKAKYAVEVRSSKFFAEEYAKIRAAELKNKHAVSRSVQSFTVKVEDLRIVKRWIESFAVKHFYSQVFLDSVYMIPFARILGLIGDASDGITAEQNRRNQGKPTIHIPVSYGVHVGYFRQPPEFVAKTRKTRLARLDAYVEPSGGDLVINSRLLQATLEADM